MFEAFTIPAINRLLRSNGWALERLRPQAGKTALLICLPFDWRATVSDSGELTSSGSDALADVTIRVTPGLLLRAAAHDETAWSAAEVAGDGEFAAAIDYLRRNLRWDYEEDLSRLTGDIAAHRIANAAREFDRWSRRTVINLGRTFAEYAIHEQPLVASAPAVEAFNREVDGLRDDAERLEKRFQLLQQSFPPARLNKTTAAD
jgi:ubiquinone biosynthesis protein UbiJ